VWPTSAVESSLVELVAPLIAPQLAPVESHQSHWYAYLRFFPCQVPVLAVRVFGTCAVPLIVGGVRLLGGCCPVPLELPEAPPVARTIATAADVTAAVMRRPITFLSSGCTSCPITLMRVISGCLRRQRTLDGPRVAARWLLRYLEERPEAMIDEAALAASCLAALRGNGQADAVQALRAMAERATRRR
jgi:hypothetical protein